MQKLKLTPVANAKKLNRNELKNIFGGDVYGSSDKGSGGKCSITCRGKELYVNCNNSCSFGSNWVGCNGDPSYETAYCM